MSRHRRRSICCCGASVGGLGCETIAESFPFLFHPFICLLCSLAPVCVKGQQKAQAGAGDRHMAACMVPWHLPRVLCKQGCACLAQTELSHPSHPTGIWFCSLSAAQGCAGNSSSCLSSCREQQLGRFSAGKCERAKERTKAMLLVFIFR